MIKERKKIRVGVSVGDLNGIGMEVIIKTFEDKRMMDFCTPVIFSSAKTSSY
ncbi:MAG: 4-hydroxythreonine-4-phosphate dehydrogenase PdxA, partial [Flavobacteriales bacterium]